MTREEKVRIGSLELACGATLPAVEQMVTIYGTPAEDGSNVVLVEHALTGSSRAADWWPGIVGERALFDPRECCIVGINALGGCYGSTGPATPAPDGVSYRQRFPRVTVADIVYAEMLALEAIGIERIELVIGGSLGGMRALQWAINEPGRVGTAVMVGAHDHHSAMGIAFNALQRDALALDSALGLRLARKIALTTYKSDELLRTRHERRPDRYGKPLFDVEGYLEHQADRFASRMDPDSYVVFTHAMDGFDVRTGTIQGTVAPRLIFVGITSDWLFRPQDVRAAARRFVLRGFDARYLQLSSTHGHDAFLAEPQALRSLLEPYLRKIGAASQ